jgi:hypothetical protein
LSVTLFEHELAPALKRDIVVGDCPLLFAKALSTAEDNDLQKKSKIHFRVQFHPERPDEPFDIPVLIEEPLSVHRKPGASSPGASALLDDDGFSGSAIDFVDDIPRVLIRTMQFHRRHSEAPASLHLLQELRRSGIKQRLAVALEVDFEVDI